MKMELGEKRPIHFPEEWPGQYDIFSFMEFACGIPQLLFAITTTKANGKPNVCFHAWTSFTGDPSGYFAVVGNLFKEGHTYQNIARTGEFVINFFGKQHYDACLQTITHNQDADDEMAAGGFTSEASRTVAPPRIGEAFLCMECTLEKEVELSAGSRAPLLVGRVRHIAMEEAYAKGIDKKYGEDGFMLNIDSPLDWSTGKGAPTGLAVCKVVKGNEA